MLIKATTTKLGGAGGGGPLPQHPQSTSSEEHPSAGAAAGGSAPPHHHHQQRQLARDLAESFALASRRVREVGADPFAGAAGDSELLWFAGSAWNAALDAQRAGADWAAVSSLFSSSAIF